MNKLKIWWWNFRLFFWYWWALRDLWFAYSCKPASVAVSDAIAAMTDEQRMELFGPYCRFCGCADPSCQCWNDE